MLVYGLPFEPEHAHYEAPPDRYARQVAAEPSRARRELSTNGNQTATDGYVAIGKSGLQFYKSLIYMVPERAAKT